MFGRLVAVPASGALLLGPLSAARAIAAPQSPGQNPFRAVPLAKSSTVDGAPLVGTFDVTQFVAQGGQVFAVSTLHVAGSPLDGATVQLPVTATEGAAAQAAAAQATCQILHLELGPLDLNLLGLVVHLDRVVLDITAQQAPGNLLGNLLCAIANLLNSNGAATALAQLLNQLLRIFG
jgi:hypothetical protein